MTRRNPAAKGMALLVSTLLWQVSQTSMFYFIIISHSCSESLVVPFEQCEQDLKDVGIQSSRVHGEYIDWKNLFLLDIPSNLQRRFNSDKVIFILGIYLIFVGSF